jgi:hypothetical protein
VNHNIDTEPHEFERIITKRMPFLIIENQASYNAGDCVLLFENNDDGERTGRTATAKIVFVTNYQQKEGWIVAGLAKIQHLTAAEKP